jgi:Skp family chaperone for outer membrane proteins
MNVREKSNSAMQIKHLAMALALSLGLGLGLSTKSLPASSQGLQGKIAVVNPQRAILTTDVGEKRVKALRKRKDYVALREQLEEWQEEGQDLEKKLRKDGSTMKDSKRRDIQRKLAILRADIEHQARKLQAMNTELLENLNSEMGEQLREILDSLIKSEGIGMLLFENPEVVRYVDSNYDLTGRVAERLNNANN